MSKTFNPQSAIVTNTTPFLDADARWTPDIVPDCDLRNPNAQRRMRSDGEQELRTASHRDVTGPAWISGWGNRPTAGRGSISVDRQLANGVALTAGFYRTSYGNFTVTRNTAVSPSDYDPYCIAGAERPAAAGGRQRTADLRTADIKPREIRPGRRTSVTLAKNYGNATEYYNGFDVNPVARLPRGINVSGGWNIGNSISLPVDVARRDDVEVESVRAS